MGTSTEAVGEIACGHDGFWIFCDLRESPAVVVSAEAIANRYVLFWMVCDRHGSFGVLTLVIGFLRNVLFFLSAYLSADCESGALNGCEPSCHHFPSHHAYLNVDHRFAFSKLAPSWADGLLKMMNIFFYGPVD